MARLVDADALKHELKVYGIVDYYGTQVLTKIDNAPTVDAVPVVHGRWIDDNPSDDMDVRMRCSVCGKIDTPLANWDYCPHCGAKLDGGVQDDD